MEKVYVVFECVGYEGDIVRGIYLTSEETRPRIEELVAEAHLWGDWDVDFETREIEVGVPLGIS